MYYYLNSGLGKILTLEYESTDFIRHIFIRYLPNTYIKKFNKNLRSKVYISSIQMYCNKLLRN